MKIRKIKAFDIQYDTDGDKKLAKSLPKELTFEIVDPDFDPDEHLADMVSDKTGFCIFGCQHEWMNPKWQKGDRVHVSGVIPSWGKERISSEATILEVRTNSLFLNVHTLMADLTVPKKICRPS